MSGDNLLRFYCNELKQAVNVSEEGDFATREDMCCDLISAYQCPRLVQVQAWQLRSECTNDCSVAKAHLTSALELIATLVPPDELIQEHKEHTMLEHVEKKLQEQVVKQDEESPKSRAEKESKDEADSSSGPGMSVEEGVEEQRVKLKNLDITR